MITIKSVETLMREAFNMGKEWAECYVSWFTPTDKEHKDKENECINELLKEIRNDTD